VDEVNESVAYVPVKRGSITVHNESVIHGSGANKSKVCMRVYLNVELHVILCVRVFAACVLQ
jgi:ectoine hydroxylase-related dioxygenase (phytanoyl-CoA dioxygenase family)